MSLFNKHLCYVKGGKKTDTKSRLQFIFQTVKTVENLNIILSTNYYTDTDLFFVKMGKQEPNRDLQKIYKIHA